ncbi:hypothetical protein [Helicobacter sp. 13S00477-4]|uniref:hypothetical protein n=1 Tax=Helicobacter sp. 13S00477-4 TaxID=1905759 RepID=UPI000BA6059D|nr:hypothetical protein [Helicobacter sp. 13S00477-4]PAF52652.1 hypothetical protein BKH44_00230 [Helicobacter sp. 13S00477-4]
MGVKNNFKQIQQEFKGDEKILESAFKLEKLYKKYKYFLYLLAIVLIIWFGYYKFSDYIDEKQAQKTSTIYSQLLKNPNNQALLDDLKDNSSDLYDLYLYSQALRDGDKKTLYSLKTSKNTIIKMLSDYQYASYVKNLEGLEKMNSTPIKDFAILQEAYLLYEQNKIPEAKTLLNDIQPSSSVFQIVTILKHYKPDQNPIAINKKSTEVKK